MQRVEANAIGLQDRSESMLRDQEIHEKVPTWRERYEHEAAGIPVSDPTPVTSFNPMVLSVPGRAVELQIKVSVPATGSDLPVILMSHGHGYSNFVSSLHGYGPVVDFWAAHGFVVIQPTHLDSTTLGLRDADDPQAPIYWRSRAEDMRFILDHLDQVASSSLQTPSNAREADLHC